MKLLTNPIIQALSPIGSTTPIHFKDKTIICKFYLPDGWAWYVFEGEVDVQRGYKFFGMMVHKEENFNHTCMGYFYLSDLLALIKQGFTVQLDKSAFKASYNDVLKEVVAKSWPLCRCFLNEKIVRALPPIGSTEHIPIKEKRLICVFHRLYGPSRYVFEGEFTAESGYQFFGIIDGKEKQGGYFYLSELLDLASADHPISVDYYPSFKVCYGDIFGAPEAI